MTSNTMNTFTYTLFLNLCNQYNLQVSHSILNPDTLVSLQPNLANNSYLLLYNPKSDKLNMAKEIHFFPWNNQICYTDIQPFNQKKFELLLNKYNQFIFKLKKDLIQIKLDRIKQDFI